MMRRWRNAEPARSERWKREDEAPRLNDVAPNLQALRFDLQEQYEGRNVESTRSVRHIIVTRAAALFEIPCTDTNCQGGGHDITHEVLQALRDSRANFEGEDLCRGYVGNRDCGRVLKFTAHASFGPDPQK